MEIEEFIKLITEQNGIIRKKKFNSLKFDFSRIDDDILGQFEKISFEGCEFKNDFLLSNLKNEFIDFTIKDCLFESDENFKFFLSSFNCSSINISQSVIKGNIIIKNIEAFDIIITDISCSKLYLKNCSSETIDVYNKPFVLKNREYSAISQIHIKSPETETIKVNSFVPLELVNVYETKKIDLNGFFDVINLASSQFEYLTLSTVEIDSDFVGKINHLTISDRIINGYILITYQHILKLSVFNTFINSGAFVISNSNIDEALFIDSSLANSSWNSVRFKDTLSIVRTDVSKIKLMNVYWLNNKKISNSHLDESIPIFYKWLSETYLIKKKKYYNKQKIQNLSQEKDAYRQLKAASFANHNLTESLAFYRNEMRLYWKEIRITGGVNWQDRILVFLNRWVSDFGQSWLLPLAWLFGVHFLLFMSIYEWQFSKDLNNFKTGLGEYFQLLNPVHKTPDYINTGMGLFTEFWMRVLSGFFIYHFIRATRKFAKI